jgi:osmotically-inducible protein OsmY
MIRALFRMLFRGVLFVVLAAAALGVYHLYRTGRLPMVERAFEDTALRGAVAAAFAIHRDLSRRDITVSADGGTVELSGRVGSEEEKAAAEELAGSVEGVTEVANRLEVDDDLSARSEETPSLGDKLDDVALLAKVRTALHLDREARRLELDVAVSSGTVVLKGVVPTEALAERIRTRVRSVGGVSELDDQLVLAPEDESE